MAHFEREENGEVQALGDLPQVRRMVASGALKGSDRVRVDGQAWGLAKDHPQLSSLFRPSPDLWSAWDEEDLEPEVSAPSSSPEAPPQRPPPGAGVPWQPGPPPAPRPLPPPAALTPAPPEAPSARAEAEPETEEVPKSHLVSPSAGIGPQNLPDDALAPLPPPAPVGKVIAFPGPKRVPSRAPAGSAAPRYQTTPLLVHEGLEPLTPVLDKTEERLPGPFQTRHYWMIASILVTGFLTLMMVVWVRGTASWTSDAPIGPMVSQPELPVLPQPVVVAEDPQSDPPAPQPSTEPALSEVVSELRQRIPSDARPLGSDPSAMEDVLFVELRRVVALDRVQIKVLEFDAADRPSSLELKVVLQEEGAVDLSRSFAAIGLVVGKFVDREGLHMPVLKVLLPTDEGTLEKAFDGDRAAAFWRGELGAQAYLRGR